MLVKSKSSRTASDWDDFCSGIRERRIAVEKKLELEQQQTRTRVKFVGERWKYYTRENIQANKSGSSLNKNPKLKPCLKPKMGQGEKRRATVSGSSRKNRPPLKQCLKYSVKTGDILCQRSSISKVAIEPQVLPDSILDDMQFSITSDEELQNMNIITIIEEEDDDCETEVGCDGVDDDDQPCTLGLAFRRSSASNNIQNSKKNPKAPSMLSNTTAWMKEKAEKFQEGASNGNRDSSKCLKKVNGGETAMKSKATGKEANKLTTSSVKGMPKAAQGQEHKLNKNKNNIEGSNEIRKQIAKWGKRANPAKNAFTGMFRKINISSQKRKKGRAISKEDISSPVVYQEDDIFMHYNKEKCMPLGEEEPTETKSRDDYMLRRYILEARRLLEEAEKLSKTDEVEAENLALKSQAFAKAASSLHANIILVKESDDSIVSSLTGPNMIATEIRYEVGVKESKDYFSNSSEFSQQGKTTLNFLSPNLKDGNTSLTRNEDTIPEQYAEPGPRNTTPIDVPILVQMRKKNTHLYPSENKTKETMSSSEHPSSAKSTSSWRLPILGSRKKEHVQKSGKNTAPREERSNQVSSSNSASFFQFSEMGESARKGLKIFAENFGQRVNPPSVIKFEAGHPNPAMTFDSNEGSYLLPSLGLTDTGSLFSHDTVGNRKASVDYGSYDSRDSDSKDTVSKLISMFLPNWDKKIYAL